MARKTNYHNIATEEELKKVNPDNITLLESWLIYLRAASRSQGTIKNYISDVNIYFVWNVNFADNKFFGNVTPKDILLFQNWLTEEMGMSSNRVRRIKDTLSSFSNYIEKFEGIEGFKNVIRDVPQPKKVITRESTILTDEDVKVILEGFINEYRYMEALMCAMVFYGGLRKNDIAEVKAGWFTKDDIVFDIFYKSPETISTKNDKQVNIYLLKKEIDRYLYLWQKQRKKLIKKQLFNECGLEYMFICRSQTNGKWQKCGSATKMTYTANYATKFLKENGIDKEFYWEAGRQYYFDYISKQNLPSNIVKILKKNT